MSASRKEIEAELAQLKIRESGWTEEVPFTTRIQQSVESRLAEGDIPRSEASSYYQTAGPTITEVGPPESHRQSPITHTVQEHVLPLGGEQVLPHKGRVHPIVEPLLKQQSLPSGLPIVAPPKSYVEDIRPQEPSHELHQQIPEPSSLEPQTTPHKPHFVEGRQEFEGTIDKAPYLGRATEVELTPKPASSLAGRRVLFLAPPNIEGRVLLKCYQNVTKTILHGEDHLTIFWTGISKDAQEANSFVGEGQEEPSISFSLRPNDIYSNENKSVIRETASSVYQLISQSDLSGKDVNVELRPASHFYWTVQKELQPYHEKNFYELVVLPCLLPGDSDPTLEKFILEHATAPVVLVRPGN